MIKISLPEGDSLSILPQGDFNIETTFLHISAYNLLK